MNQFSGYVVSLAASVNRPLPDVVVENLSDRQVRSAAALFADTLGEAADPEHVVALVQHNGNIMKRVRRVDTGKESGFFAFLPLNDIGAEALSRARFDTRHPDITHICTQKEKPAAIYIWALYGPGRFLPLAHGFSQYLDDLGMADVVLLTRPVDARLDRLYRKIGFETAKPCYPDIADEMLVRLPIVEAAPSRPRPNVMTRLIRNADDMCRIVALRAMAYMDEQNCSWAEEFEGNDFCAANILGEIEGEPVGCVRVRFFRDFAKIERLAVHPNHRGCGAAKILAQAAVTLVSQKGYDLAYGQCTEALMPFWERVGFRKMNPDKTFCFSDGEYHEILLDVIPSPDAIRVDSGPHVIIRPEGEWDKPGIYDLSATRGSDGSGNWGRR
ncbi:MAG: GNAT family N-acetyltransferase [Pacificimonas sp.]